MAITDFLEEELGLYHKLVSDESWKTALDETAAKLALNEAVSFGLFSLTRIRQRNRILSQASLEAGRAILPREEIEYLVRLYQAWLAETDKLLDTLRLSGELGSAVNRVDELRQCRREIDAFGTDVDVMIRSITAALEGRTKPLREAADEFRRRRYGSGS